jgi:hypothetical protein
MAFLDLSGLLEAVLVFGAMIGAIEAAVLFRLVKGSSPGRETLCIRIVLYQIVFSILLFELFGSLGGVLLNVSGSLSGFVLAVRFAFRGGSGSVRLSGKSLLLLTGLVLNAFWWLHMLLK